MRIYEIDQAMVEAFDAAIDPESGEITDEAAYAALEALQMERDTKCEGVACWIKDLKAEAAAIKAEADNLTKRARAAENKAERLKGYLAWALAGQKFKTSKCSVGYRTTTSVDVDPEAVQYLDEKYLRFKDPEPDKTAIKAALQDGEVLEGCRLVEKTSIIIK